MDVCVSITLYFVRECRGSAKKKGCVHSFVFCVRMWKKCDTTIATPSTHSHIQTITCVHLTWYTILECEVMLIDTLPISIMPARYKTTIRQFGGRRSTYGEFSESTLRGLKALQDGGLKVVATGGTVKQVYQSRLQTRVSRLYVFKKKIIPNVWLDSEECIYIYMYVCVYHDVTMMCQWYVESTSIFGSGEG